MPELKKKTTLSWITGQVHKRLPAIITMLAAYVGVSLLTVAFALGSRKVIDTAVAGKMDDFIDACILQGAIIIGIILCLTIYRHLKDRSMSDLDRDWKQKLLDKLLHGDYPSVAKYHSAELINRMNNDVRILDDGIVTMIPSVAGMITKVAAAAAALAVLDLRFALCLGIAGVILITVTGLLRAKLKSLNKKVSEHEGRVSAFLQETVENLLAVQAMDVAGEMNRRADVLLEDRYQTQRKRKNVTLFANTGISVISYAVTFIALVWCSYKLLKGEISFGTLMAVTQLVGQLRGPLVNMSGIMPRYAAMTAAAERLMEIESIENISEEPDVSPEALYGEMMEIGGKNVSFSYDRDFVLKNADFSFRKGEFTVIAGQSGIGKSTLFKLMLGIYQPDGGELYIKKQDGTEQKLQRNARGLFAYVPQNNLLFSGTLRENLTVVKPEASDEEIAEAVHISCMDEYVAQLPEGLDTVIGESAAGLSEGQAQRLAIGRAILSGAPVLLLDECTSALDQQTEKIVLDRIKALQDKTCIAVTHRRAAFDICDYILNVDEMQQS